MNQTEKKKKAILETTFKLLNERAINDITVEQIAQEAAVSKVTLFKYYQSKNHLMNLVIMRSFEHMAEEIQSIIDSQLTFEETYQSITDLKLLHLERYSSVFSENLMTQYSQSPDFFNQDTVAIQKEIYQHLFTKGQLEGKIAADLTFDDFWLITSIFIQGMKGMSSQVLFDKSDLISRFFLNGFK